MSVRCSRGLVAASLLATSCATLVSVPPVARADDAREAREVERTCRRLADDRGRAAFPFGPDVHVGLERALGCPQTPMWPGERIPEDATSTVASLGWVGGCLSVQLDDLPDADGLRRRLPAFAVCGVEGRSIERAALVADLEPLHLPRGARDRVLRYHAQLEALLGEFDALLARDVAREPALRALFYDAPAQAWRDGRAYVTQGAAVRAVVARFADAAGRGKSAVGGCAVELRDAIVGRMRAAKVTTLDRAVLGARDPIGQPAMRALVACARMEGAPALVEAAREVLGRADDHEGVRTLVYWYVHDEVRRLRKDRGDFWFAERDLPRPPTTVYPFHDTAPFDRYVLKAPVRAVARRGDDVQLRFDEVRWREHEKDCRETDRIDAVGADGKVRYRTECKDLGVEAKRFTEAPVVIAAEHAGGVAAGRSVELMCDRRGERRRCVPILVWHDADKRRLVGLLGAAL